MIHIYLDSVNKAISPTECRRVSRAKCGEFESVGDESNINRVAKLLLEHGYDPGDEVHILRGNTLCFNPDTLVRWAEGRQGRKTQPQQLKKTG